MLLRSLAVIPVLFLPSAVLALPVTGLYSHEVPVQNQNDSERQRAFREAMEAVIVKVTGERRWLENSAITQAVASARNFVEAIEYRTETVNVELTEPEGLQGLPDGNGALPQIRSFPQTRNQDFLTVRFSRGLVDRLLADAAIPVWDSNRPSVLVWMALQNDAGERSLLSADTNPGIIALMRDFAAERGLPIIFPVLDFEDRRTLSADMIWGLDERAIVAASARYAPDSILAGRLLITASGDLVGLWQFIFQDRVEVFDSLDDDLVNYINEPLDRITSQLARHFAVVPLRSGMEQARLRVEGVDSLADYAELVSYLQGLVLVDSVSVASLQGRILELDLTLQGNPGQLHELLSLDRNLSLVGNIPLEGRQVLSYRWAR